MIILFLFTALQLLQSLNLAPDMSRYGEEEFAYTLYVRGEKGSRGKSKQKNDAKIK